MAYVSSSSSDSEAARTSPISLPTPIASYVVTPRPYYGPNAADVVSARQEHLSDGQYTFYRTPLMLVEARGQYCFDDKGKQYIDAYSNVCHVGHCHPTVVGRVHSAMSNIVSNTRYLHPTIVEYAARLKSSLPSGLDTCFFVNSGSEGIDLAVRLARNFTGRKNIVVLENAYHGTTATCTGLSTALSTGSAGGRGALDYDYCARDVVVAPVPDPYRGKYQGSKAARRYAAEVGQRCTEAPAAAFLCESVQGVGGQIVYPDGFLRRAYAKARATGAVCIADEVQTGFGRSGSHFWAFEAQGAEPDIVVMGKPIGNGFPLGAVVCRREIAGTFNAMQYFNTNGGNPVACAAGLAVLDVITQENLQARAGEVAVSFMNKLREVQSQHEGVIGDVRGLGLFIGIEFVHDRETKEPHPVLAEEVMERLKARGVLVGRGGPHRNVLRIKPPICFTNEDAVFVAAALDATLKQLKCEVGAETAKPSIALRQRKSARMGGMPKVKRAAGMKKRKVRNFLRNKTAI